MIRVMVAAAVSFAALAGSVASAEPYVDYTPEKGVWNMMSAEVDPNHVDDYLKGLRRTQQIGMDIMKKRGMIDAYRIRVRNGYTKGQPNVLIETHYTSVAMLAPDKARDMAIEKEIYASLPKSEADKAVASYETYRTFLDDAYYTEVTLAR